jgi:hypothetical protein
MITNSCAINLMQRKVADVFRHHELKKNKSMPTRPSVL